MRKFYYPINPRFAEGIALDRLTNGARGVSDYDQRDLVRRGVMPSKQAVINQQLNDNAAIQAGFREQQLREQALQQTVEQQKHSNWVQRMNDYSQLQGCGIPAASFAGGQPVAQQQPRYRYGIDYQAARDAGEFLRALKGQTGPATDRQQGERDLGRALELLNKTPYSSINNAEGIQVNTDESGNEFISILGEGGKVLGELPMEEVEKQLSNLNNYATRYQMKHTPAREAVLESEELAAGAEAARAAASDEKVVTSMGYTKDGNNRYTRPGEHGGFEEFDAIAAGQEAYDNFIEEYGPQEATSRPVIDKGFYQSQTPARFGGVGLGFASATRLNKKTEAEKTNAKALAAKLAGVPEGEELPPPLKPDHRISAGHPAVSGVGYKVGIL